MVSSSECPIQHLVLSPQNDRVSSLVSPVIWVYRPGPDNSNIGIEPGPGSMELLEEGVLWSFWYIFPMTCRIQPKYMKFTNVVTAGKPQNGVPNKRFQSGGCTFMTSCIRCRFIKHLANNGILHTPLTSNIPQGLHLRCSSSIRNNWGSCKLLIRVGGRRKDNSQTVVCNTIH